MTLARHLVLVLLLALLAACAGAPAAQAPTAAPTGAPTAAPAASPAQPSATPAPTAPRRPFPQHSAYAAGTIVPSAPAAKRDAAVQAAYTTWKQTYLRAGCGDGRRYVDFGQGANGIAVSEGQGYGMLIVAYMAGYDPDAQAIFDGLYAFFRDHPSAGNPALMAWKQVEGCRDLDPGRTSSATDGDMDIAYALLLADAQWGSAGAIDYRRAALELIAALRESVVNEQNHALLLGDWVGPGDARRYDATRTSDLMPDHLRAFGSASGDAEWARVAGAGYELLAQLQREHSPQAGLLPDFAEDLSSAPRPADPGFLEGDSDGQYGYNACRVPLRIALDFLLHGDERARAVLAPINRWARESTAGVPFQVYGGYSLDGKVLPNRGYSELAFAAPLGVAAMADPANQRWLDALWGLAAGQAPLGYYPDALRMLSLIAMSGNWWSPVG